MYRKLWLKNNQGNIFTFTEESIKSFLNNPTGFGFQKTINGLTMGNITKVLSSSYNFASITGNILFYNAREQAYQDYFNFVNFISFEPIKLYYQPPNTLKPYYCDVEVMQSDKGEYNINRYLEIPLILQMTSHWQDAEETIIEVESGVADGKYYDLERPYYYGANTLDNIALTNTGQDEVGFIVEVNGSVVNPQWTIYQDNEVVGTCKLTGTFDKVIVNSRDGEQEIYLENNGSVITNPTSYQDLSITGGILTFCRLKVGQAKMVFTAGNIGTFSGNVKVHLRNSYISV